MSHKPKCPIFAANQRNIDSMKLYPLTDKKDWRLFHRAPHRVYQGDPLWVAPLEEDIESIFDPAKNAALEEGEAQLWVLLDERDRPVGRVAAFIDHARNRALPHPVGGLGFFECVDREDYAHALLEAAEGWLKQKGARAVDGPINFGERDKYWGLLVKGHGYMPLFQENYQPAYYRRFFEQRDYQPFEQILTLHGVPKDIPFDRFNRVIERLKARYDVQVHTLDWSKLPQYAADFCEIYNVAFGEYEHFKPIVPEQVEQVLRQAKPIADTNTLGIAYFEGKPAGFLALFPDINPLLQPAKGKLNWRTLPGFLWRRFRTNHYGTKGIGFGIHPDYKTKGIFAFITNYLAFPETLEKYTDLYLATVRAHNTEAVSIYFKLGVRVQRVHIAFRKALAEGVPIEPYTFIDPDHFAVGK